MPPKKKFYRPLTITFTETQIEYMEKWAEKHGQYKADLIRKALDEHIAMDRYHKYQNR